MTYPIENNIITKQTTLAHFLLYKIHITKVWFFCLVKQLLSNERKKIIGKFHHQYIKNKKEGNYEKKNHINGSYFYSSFTHG